MPLWELDLVVHSKHFKDGYPLCWDEGQEGVFEGTWDESQVTCADCIKYMNEVD